MNNDRTVPNNKPGTIIRDNEQEICLLVDVGISGDRNVMKKETEEILKCKIPYNRNTAHEERKNKSNMRGK
jgi:hypothetical protein